MPGAVIDPAASEVGALAAIANIHFPAALVTKGSG